MDEQRRRDFLTLMGLGGAVFASGLSGCSGARGEPVASPPPSGGAPPASHPDFFFLQLSDTHWGFQGPPNPDASTCLRDTVAAINALQTRPEFIVFTGDLTHTTDDAKVRRARMAEFRAIVGELAVSKLIFLPGEHDAAPDRGEAYREAFGETRGSFEHKGVSFLRLDNASAPGGEMGAEQLEWLSSEVAKAPAHEPLVVLAHRPLFALYPQWEWATKDGASAIDILSRHPNVTVFYGHIHQEHHHTTGAVVHHSARSLVFPLPAPGSVPKRAPLPWDQASSDHGLGYRSIRLSGARAEAREVPYAKRADAAVARVP